ncbi:hypothetical protein HK096_009753, partial [Nowakowskiella sp. JEL0078]
MNMFFVLFFILIPITVKSEADRMIFRKFPRPESLKLSEAFQETFKTKKRNNPNSNHKTLKYHSENARNGEIIPGAYMIELKTDTMNISESNRHFNNHLKKRQVKFKDRVEFDQKKIALRSIHLDNLGDIIHLHSYLSVERVWSLRWIGPPNPIDKFPHENIKNTLNLNLSDYINGPKIEVDKFGTIDDPAKVLIGVKKAREELDLSGKGVLVGIIDTGIDYKHSAFGSCETLDFPDSCPRIAIARDYATSNSTVGSDPMDCLGHGTHVA